VLFVDLRKHVIK
jgi:hypothetical protein